MLKTFTMFISDVNFSIFFDQDDWASLNANPLSIYTLIYLYFKLGQDLSQDLETRCPKLAIVKVVCVLFFKGGHNILRL